MELVNDINKDNVFVHLDTHHMNIEESDFSAACKACGDKLRCDTAPLWNAVDARFHLQRQRGFCLHGLVAALASKAGQLSQYPLAWQGQTCQWCTSWLGRTDASPSMACCAVLVGAGV